MIRTVIVEDDDAAAELLAGYLDRYGGEHGETFSSVRYDNAVTFLEKYASDADIVFMDIEMEDLDGMKAAAKLRERDRSVTLIFVTNMAQFAIKGYEVDALDFIVKPVGYHDFAFRLKKAVARIRANEEKYVSVNLLGGGHAKAAVSRIKYVEIMKHRMIWHTEDGDLESYGTLKNAESVLPREHFARCNSCYLVNLRFVRSVRDMICDVAGDKLKVSQPKKREFLKSLGDYIGGGLDV